MILTGTFDELDSLVSAESMSTSGILLKKKQKNKNLPKACLGSSKHSA